MSSIVDVTHSTIIQQTFENKLKAIVATEELLSLINESTVQNHLAKLIHHANDSNRKYFEKQGYFPLHNSESSKDDKRWYFYNKKRKGRNTTNVFNKITNYVKEKLKRENILGENHTSDPLALIVSFPLCDRQDLHMDFDPTKCDINGIKKCKVVLVGLMDGSSIDHPISTNLLTTTDIPKGGIVVFDGDFIHGGSAYSSANVRLHLLFQDVEVSRDVVDGAAWLRNPDYFRPCLGKEAKQVIHFNNTLGKSNVERLKRSRDEKGVFTKHHKKI